MRGNIPMDAVKIAEFCGRNGISKLSFFGSVLREDFGPDSDIDVLAEFEPEHAPGFLRLHAIQEELSALLGGRSIDLITPRFLNPRIRQRVLEQRYGQMLWMAA